MPDDTVALHLYRIAQEAVTNAVKHSGAKNVLITLDRNPTHICVSVQDDGKGFVVRPRRKGLGLHMMRYRANALGGELKIATAAHWRHGHYLRDTVETLKQGTQRATLGEPICD